MSTPDARTLNRLDELRDLSERAEAQFVEAKAVVREAKAHAAKAYDLASRCRMAHGDAVTEALGVRTTPLFFGDGPVMTIRSAASARARRLAIAVMLACLVVGGFVGHFLWSGR